jgi:hypothetical protein
LLNSKFSTLHSATFCDVLCFLGILNQKRPE